MSCTQLMSKLQTFILVSTLLVIFSGIITFKNFKNLRKSIYWLVFPDMVSIFSKKLWDKDFENTFRFEKFLVLSVLLVGVNAFFFKFLL